nr:Mariner Mos1 transposase [Hymenolepis microstoma]CUU99541.1 Mariner Mos1 transposase [Hymenolepis microstoma]
MGDMSRNLVRRSKDNDQLDVIHYERLKPPENITGDAPEPCSRRKKNSHSTTRLGHDKAILQYDNTRPHVAKLVVKKYIETLKWQILPHPPYSPGVAPSHFHLTHLAQWHTSWLTSTSARMKK